MIWRPYAAGPSSPSLAFNNLQDIHVRISEKHRCSPRLAAGILHPFCLQPLFDRLDGFDTNTDMSILPSVLRSARQWIRVWQHHEVQHLWAHPQPKAIIR
ncbi:hypothetical protein ABBQ32_009541 [Trebouxia sp. C0010 RCD-2024]